MADAPTSRRRADWSSRSRSSGSGGSGGSSSAAATSGAARACSLALLFASASALNFQILADSSKCAYEFARKHQKAIGMYEVASGGFLDVNFEVKAPSGKVVLSHTKRTEGKFDFVSEEEGLYEFCFGNAGNVAAKGVQVLPLPPPLPLPLLPSGGAAAAASVLLVVQCCCC